MNGSVLQCFSVSFLSPWPIMVTSIFCSSIFIGSLVAMSHYVMVSESFFFGSKERFGIQPKRRGGRQVVCVCVYYLSDSLFFFPTRRCVSFTGVAALFAIRFSRVSLAYRSSCPVRPCVPVLPPHAVFLTWFQTRDQRKISSKPPPDIYEKKSPLPSLSLSLSNPKTFGNGGLRYRTALPRVCVASLTVSYLWESRLLSNLEGRKLGGGSLGGWG